jgi:hypothetical protein
MVEPKEKIDTHKSKTTIMKKIIDYVVTSLNYQKTLLALVLLSIVT